MRSSFPFGLEPIRLRASTGAQSLDLKAQSGELCITCRELRHQICVLYTQRIARIELCSAEFHADECLHRERMQCDWQSGSSSPRSVHLVFALTQTKCAVALTQTKCAEPRARKQTSASVLLGPQPEARQWHRNQTAEKKVPGDDLFILLFFPQSPHVSHQ
jgi:hypothetical protein